MEDKIMDNEKYYITDQNDMFTFFQVINQIEPVSVVDVGMFLKRIGGVSRNILDQTIDENLRLDAVEVIDNISLPVYDTIYNDIITLEKINSLQNPELVIMMRLTGILDDAELKHVVLWASENARYIVTDADTYREMCKYNLNVRVREITVDSDIYYLILLS